MTQISIKEIIVLANILLALLSVNYLTKPGKLKLFAIYFIFAAGTEIICYSLAKAGIHNLFLFHLFVPVEFFLLGFSLSKHESKYQDLFDSAIWFIGILLTSYCALTPWDSIPYLALVVESFVLFIFAIRIFYTTPNKQTVATLAFGILFFFSQNTGTYYYYSLPDISIPLNHIEYITIISLIIYNIGMFNATRNK